MLTHIVVNSTTQHAGLQRGAPMTKQITIRQSKSAQGSGGMRPSGRKRGAGDGNYRLRPDGRWEVRFTLPSGKSKSLYGKTRQDVQQKHRAALRDLDNGLDLSAGPQT